MANISASFTNIIATLPEINGEIGVGIAAGVDSALPDDLKLKVCVIDGDDSLLHTALNAAAAVFTRTNLGDAQKLFAVRCAYGAVLTGLVREGDGDSVAATEAETVEQDAAAKITTCLQPDLVKKALTMCIATKINWWGTNHHTGQGKMQGYAKKVAMSVMCIPEEDLDKWIDVVHMCGHWLSTKATLIACGIRHISDESAIHYVRQGVKAIAASADLVLRVGGFPAGTHKHALAHAALKKLGGHIIASISPVILEIEPVLINVVRIKRAPAEYHVGARYLCGGVRTDFSDAAADLVLGRLVTFITTFFSNSTLAASPHVKKGASSYDDYSSQYAALCQQVKKGLTDLESTDVKKFISDNFGALTSINKEYLVDSLTAVTRNQMPTAYVPLPPVVATNPVMQPLTINTQQFQMPPLSPGHSPANAQFPLFTPTVTPNVNRPTPGRGRAIPRQSPVNAGRGRGAQI